MAFKELDQETWNIVAQNAHMLAGSTVAFGFLLLTPKIFWWVLLAFAVITAVKEFYWDEHFEDAEVRGSNLNDWIHYQLGWIIAGGLYCAKIHWLTLWSIPIAILLAISIYFACKPWIVKP